MIGLARIGLIALLFWVQSDSSKPGTELLGFDLNESRSEIISRLGQPDGVDDSSPNYISWFFKLGAQDEHNFNYVLCFRRSDRKLISITRNFEGGEKTWHGKPPVLESNSRP